MGKRTRTDGLMILDATAGNRTMWLKKDPVNIIFADMEKRLHIKPTIFCDIRKSPFRTNQFDTIIFDPPHMWGGEIDYKPTYPAEIKKLAQKFKGKPFTYYGWDKYQSRLGLIAYVAYCEAEFKQLLKHDGLLWLKWNEVRIPLNRIITIFADWNILMRIKCAIETHTLGKADTYWVLLNKKNKEGVQTTLL